MKSVLITNIKSLVGIRSTDQKLVRGADMKTLPSIENAFVLIEDGLIKDFGPMVNAPEQADEVIDATGKLVLPAWCDSHTHIVYAGSREVEFVDKINGLTYEEIAARGGGILNSAQRLANASEEELFDSAWQRLEEMQSLGTGAVEIKSGYGLSYEAELKMLRVIRKLKEKSKLSIKATFLGAHAYPAQFKTDHEGYLKLLLEELLPTIASEGLADFIDVFCEENYFSPTETDRILAAGVKHGLKPKVHVNQFNVLGGVGVCVKNSALSVDHLEHISDEDIAALRGSATMPVALPGCSLFIKIPYTLARKIIDAGLPLALATDFNPGSAPSGNMNLVNSLACINMGMAPEEVINASTLNGAYAMDVANTLGSITIGKRANIIITRPVNSLAMLPYSFGSNPVERVIMDGR
ncbi:MAG TPA: imidazolonepropionase [Chitinophagales bacterium]|nr:imidazolonepropionase [Chitinophagales bacterium]